MSKTKHDDKIPPEGVRCQLEECFVLRKEACEPGECQTCGWNLDNQKGKVKTAAMRYRKKPVEVEAFRRIGDHGRQEGPEGEIYPCKPDIFSQTYEPFWRSEEVAADG